MMLVATKVDEVTRWCNKVHQRGLATERAASLRERSVIQAAFSSADERLWALGDSLLALLPAGPWADRVRVVREIEGQLGGVK